MSSNTTYGVLQSWELPDFRGTGTLYRHLKSGAQVFHLANDDPENMFAFSFATLPEDSTGVAHILEHTVLCGSREFPLKDPFLQLLKGSVNTFLNAMTYPDKTVYPAASPVRQDLFNMMKVYGDAVFHPLLKPEFFRQEGHRLQFTPQGDLEITGIVYNEMKGNYSSPDSIAAEKCYQSLFPDTLYRHDSGGDPAVIPELTFEEFEEFHRRYYHPSNARIILYGDIPAEEYLEFLDREFLGAFQESTTFLVQDEQPRWEAPRVFETTYPVEPQEDLSRRSSVTLNWLLFPVTETRRLLAASILTEILLGNSGAPLTKALIDSGLGQDVSPVFGLETDLREAVFSVGLRGTDTDQAQAIEELTLSTLRDLARKGFEPELVEGALRRVEFHHREQKSGPSGMRVMNRVLRSWMYGGSPAAGLRFSEDLEALRDRLSRDPRFFEAMIEELLLDNTHRSTVIVRPDPDQTRREEEALREELARRRDSLIEAEEEQIRRETADLERLQTEPDDPRAVETVPFLSLEDVPREIRRTPFLLEPLGSGASLYRHNEATRGILYLDLAFDFGRLSPREEALLNLLGGAFTETGLPGLSFDQFNRQVNLKTGGISVYVSNQTHLKDLSRVRRLFMVRLKVLDRAWQEGAELLKRLLGEIDFSDSARLVQILEEMLQEMLGGVVPAGNYFAGLRALRGLNGLLAAEEEINGISQLLHLRRMVQEDPDALGRELLALALRLMDPARVNVNITGSKPLADELSRWLPSLLETLRSRREAFSREGGLEEEVFLGEGDVPGVILPPGTAPGREYLLASAGVSYVAAALRGVSFGEPLAAAQDVVAHLLRTGLLWEKIRMQGGAYGAFAQSRTAEGVFSFASYRDPHCARTIRAYQESLRELAREEVSPGVLDLAKVSMLGRELRPLTPREAGFMNFRRRLLGVDDELRQMTRDQVRAVSPGEIRQVAELLGENFSEASLAVLGGKAALKELRRDETLPGRTGEFVLTELGL
ncbi:hypothetical protein SAMN05920897_10868 [Alkalispirochaeta americana]|uniref:Peptidase M16C associated domain-containing protein n=1 Tax=Alkalispirochaeta americana TaxID=159291 RepID=A0A1N6SG01_9SPIO|nr:insulinase family protein [Alkalispirochaeta americana]SIQ40028.1 hypothetical protein SAMN05920897_10868 [Alkalispirochaeta americana]